MEVMPPFLARFILPRRSFLALPFLLSLLGGCSEDKSGADPEAPLPDLPSSNRAPTANADFVATDPDQPLQIDALRNDSDPEGDALVLRSAGRPAHGKVELKNDVLVYTPAPGYVGLDSFTYLLADAPGATASSIVHVGVGDFPAGAPRETVVASTGVLSSFDPIGVPSISDDGRFVAFYATTSWSPDDTDQASDVYVLDRGRRELRRMSVGAGGAPPNGPSFSPQLSGDGRYVVFESSASNLIEGDTNGVSDVFRRDLRTGEVLRVSVGTAGGQGDGASGDAKISDDGDVVVFLSRAGNLVAGDGNGFDDVFVRTISSGTTVRASVTPSGGDIHDSPRSPMVSGDGGTVAFWTGAGELVDDDHNLLQDVFVRVLASSTTTRVSVSSSGVAGDGDSRYPSLSRDGRVVAFVSLSTNLTPDGASGTFVRDLASQTTTRVGEMTYWPQLTDDGTRLVAHTATEAFLHNRKSGARTTLVPRDGTRWYWPTPSGNGRYVVVGESGSSAVIVEPLQR